MAQLTIEFYGIPRQRAGRAELTVNATSAADVLAEAVAACPGLCDVLTPNGQLARHYLLSLNGERFVTDLREPLPSGSRLLLLSADAGG